MKRKLSLDDRMWLWGNKKPPTVWGAYISDKCIWFALGLWSSLAALGMGSGKEGIILGVLLVLFITWFAIFAARQDKERGYADAIHKNNVDRWEKRMAKIKGEEIKTDEK